MITFNHLYLLHEFNNTIFQKKELKAHMACFYNNLVQRFLGRTAKAGPPRQKIWISIYQTKC